MTSGNVATIYFDGEHIHSANTLTVYIDNAKECSYEGGRSCSVAVTPGSHVITVFVQNNVSKKDYWLGPFREHFEAGVEYNLAPENSGYEEKTDNTYHPTGRVAAGTGNRSGYSILIITAVIAVVLAGSIALSFLASGSPGSKNRTGAGQVMTSSRRGFIFPDSDKILIQQREAEELSDSDLTYAIYEIYARHGYIFREKEVRRYYKKFKWYTGDVPANEFSLYSFNRIEQQNWSLLVNERNRRKASG